MSGERLLAILEQLRRRHLVVDEDCWFSCPKSGEACGLDERKLREDECSCGADQHNALIDEAVALVRKW